MEIIRILIKTLLFLSSYIPLWIILGVRYYPLIKFYGFICILAFIIVLCVILFAIIYLKTNKLPNRKIIVENYENLTSTYIEYLITYIIPFMQIDLNLYNCLSLIILFIFVWWLYINSNLIYVNPILKLMKYNLYKVKDEVSKREYILLTRKEKIMIGEEISGYRFYSDDIILER